MREPPSPALCEKILTQGSNICVVPSKDHTFVSLLPPDDPSFYAFITQWLKFSSVKKKKDLKFQEVLIQQWQEKIYAL